MTVSQTRWCTSHLFREHALFWPLSNLVVRRLASPPKGIRNRLLILVWPNEISLSVGGLLADEDTDISMLVHADSCYRR